MGSFQFILSNTHYCEFLKEYTVLDPEGQTVSLFPSGPLALQEINSVCPSGSKTVYS